MKITIISFGKFHSFDLARELKSKGHEIKIYSSYPYFIAKKYNLNLSNYYSFFFLFIIDRLLFNKLSFTLKNIFAFLVSLSIKYDNDVFILWSDMSPSLIKKIRKRSPKSIIVIERGSAHIISQTKLLTEEYEKFNLKYIPDPYDNDIETLNYQLSDYISLPSKFSKKTFIENGINPKKLFVNPYGTDLTKFYKLNMIKEKFTILTCGLASIQKGFFHVLESHQFIKGDFKHIHVGKIESNMKKYINQYPKLEVHGSIPKDELINFYNQSDVLVFTSIQDGFGMVILEAMACGLPVIATANTGYTTIESDNLKFGFLVDLRSPKQIAEKINILKKDKSLLDELSKNSIDIITKGGFKWKDYGRRYSEFIESITHSK